MNLLCFFKFYYQQCDYVKLQLNILSRFTEQDLLGLL